MIFTAYSTFKNYNNDIDYNHQLSQFRMESKTNNKSVILHIQDENTNTNGININKIKNIKTCMQFDSDQYKKLSSSKNNLFVNFLYHFNIDVNNLLAGAAITDQTRRYSYRKSIYTDYLRKLNMAEKALKQQKVNLFENYKKLANKNYEIQFNSDKGMNPVFIDKQFKCDSIFSLNYPTFINANFNYRFMDCPTMCNLYFTRFCDPADKSDNNLKYIWQRPTEDACNTQSHFELANSADHIHMINDKFRFNFKDDFSNIKTYESLHMQRTVFMQDSNMGLTYAFSANCNSFGIDLRNIKPTANGMYFDIEQYSELKDLFKEVHADVPNRVKKLFVEQITESINKLTFNLENK